MSIKFNQRNSVHQIIGISGTKTRHTTKPFLLSFSHTKNRTSDKDLSVSHTKNRTSDGDPGAFATDMLAEGGQSSEKTPSLGALFDEIDSGDSDCNPSSNVDCDYDININTDLGYGTEKIFCSSPSTPPAAACSGSPPTTTSMSTKTGFICPQCREEMPSMDELLKHHEHCKKSGNSKSVPYHLTGYICPRCLSQMPSADALLEHNVHCTYIRQSRTPKDPAAYPKKRSVPDINTGIAAMVAASAGETPDTPPRASMFRRRLGAVSASQAADRVETPAEATAHKIVRRFHDQYIAPFVQSFGGPIDESYLQVGKFVETCAHSMLKAYLKHKKSPFRKKNAKLEDEIRIALCEEVESEVMGELYESIWVSMYSKSVKMDATLVVRIKLLQDAGVDLIAMAGVADKFLFPLVKGHSEEVPYQAAIHALATLTSYGNLFPTEQRRLFVAMVKMIYNEAQARSTASGCCSILAADNFLPLLIYVALNCREMGHPLAVVCAMRSLSNQVSGETEYYITSLEFALHFILRQDLAAEVEGHHVAALLHKIQHEHAQAIERRNTFDKELASHTDTPLHPKGSKGPGFSFFNKTSKYYVEPALPMRRRPRRSSSEQSECSLVDDAGWVQTIKFYEIQYAFLLGQISQLEAARTELTQFPGSLAAGKDASPLAFQRDVPPDTPIRMKLSRKSCVAALPIVSVLSLPPPLLPLPPPLLSLPPPLATIGLGNMSVVVDGELHTEERGRVLVFQPREPLPSHTVVRVTVRWPWTLEGAPGVSVFTFRTVAVTKNLTQLPDEWWGDASEESGVA